MADYNIEEDFDSRDAAKRRASDAAERSTNVKKYHAKRAYKSLVQFHSDIYELRKVYKDDLDKLGVLAELDFEILFERSKSLAGIDYGNTVGFGAKKTAETVTDDV
jgi:hypothetical protein